MLATRLISLGTLALLAQLCVAAGVQAGVIAPFQSTETGSPPRHSSGGGSR